MVYSGVGHITRNNTQARTCNHYDFGVFLERPTAARKACNSRSLVKYLVDGVSLKNELFNKKSGFDFVISSKEETTNTVFLVPTVKTLQIRMAYDRGISGAAIYLAVPTRALFVQRGQRERYSEDAFGTTSSRTIRETVVVRSRVPKGGGIL